MRSRTEMFRVSGMPVIYIRHFRGMYFSRSIGSFKKETGKQNKETNAGEC